MRNVKHRGVQLLGTKADTNMKRNVALKMDTYKQLERYKVDLVKEKESPKITYDDAILSLLKEHYGE
jgi:hypothetical protein